MEGSCSACGDGDTAMRYHNHDPLPRSYTLDEIKALAREWCEEFDANDLARLTVSTLLRWLARREKEGGDGY